MYIQVTEREFIDLFKRIGGENRFSCYALCALFEYLESYEEETREPYILDVIGECCEWTEYENRADFIDQNAYPTRYTADEVRNMNDDEFFGMMGNYTQVIQLGDTSNDGFLVKIF